MAACGLCGLAERRSELIVQQTPSWVLVHVDRLFTAGSLFLLPREHMLTPQIDATLWAEAAPLIANGTRVVTEVGGAERVYLCSFSESLQHFHMLFLRRRPEDPAAHGGARAAALVDAIAKSNPAFDASEAASWVGRYRAALGT